MGKRTEQKAAVQKRTGQKAVEQNTTERKRTEKKAAGRKTRHKIGRETKTLKLHTILGRRIVPVFVICTIILAVISGFLYEYIVMMIENSLYWEAASKRNYIKEAYNEFEDDVEAIEAEGDAGGNGAPAFEDTVEAITKLKNGVLLSDDELELVKAEEYRDNPYVRAYFDFMNRLRIFFDLSSGDDGGWQIDSKMTIYRASDQSVFLENEDVCILVYKKEEARLFYKCEMDIIRNVLDKLEELDGKKRSNAQYEISMKDVFLYGDNFLPGVLEINEYHERYNESTGFTMVPGKTVAVFDYTKRSRELLADKGENNYQHILMDSKINQELFLSSTMDVERRNAIFSEYTENVDVWNLSGYSYVERNILNMQGVDSQKINLGNQEFILVNISEAAISEDYIKIYVAVVIAIYAICFAIVFVRSKILFVKYQAEHQNEEFRRRITDAMAHDLKSPLAAILGYAENLQCNTHPEKNEYYIQSVLDHINYMRQIIDDTLTLSRVEDIDGEVNMTDVDTQGLVYEILELYQEAVDGKNLKICIDGNAIIRGNRQMFVRGMDNLIGNAVKYTPADGTIRIELKSDKIVIKYTCQEEFDVSVSELWKPFQKGNANRYADDKSKGTGVGLSIARQIFLLHGYEMILSLEADEFVVTLKRDKKTGKRTKFPNQKAGKKEPD